MVIPTSKYGLTGVLVVLVIFAYFVNAEAKPLQDTDPVNEVIGESDDGDPVDVILIGEEDDPRGVVLRRWRRFIRNTVFRPAHFIKKAIAAMVVPATLAGAVAGTIASSIVGVGAGGVTGVIAGAGLGGLGGLLVPGRSILARMRNRAKSKKSKDSDKRYVTKETKDNEEEDDDDKDDKDDEDDEDDEGDGEDLGRNAPLQGSGVNDGDRAEMVLLLRGAINVDRLYELRKKMKLLKIKNKFKSKRRHYIWN